MTWAGPLAALLSSLTWALGVSVYARLSPAYGATAVNTTRAALAAPLFLLLALGERGGPAGLGRFLLHLPAAPVGALVVSILCSYALADVLFLRSAHHLGVPSALAIASAYPLWAALAGTLFRGEPLGAGRLLGVLAVVGGTAFVLGTAARVGEPGAGGPRSPGRGLLLAVATSLLWALNTVAVSAGGRGLSIGIASLMRMLFALLLCPLLGRWLPPRGPARPPLLPRSALRGVLWAFLVEGFGGTLLFTYGMARSPLAVGAALSSLAPVIAVPIALVTRAERFSPVRTLGVLLVVGGIFLLVL